MPKEYSTPLMKQYLSIKAQYPDCILFFRLGDFYEMFMEDAQTGAQVLDITLTARPEGRDGKVPMAGVPYHAVDSYLAKMVKAGYKVAICEQMSEPNKKGIVEREVIRVVTPGTLLDEKTLERKEHNYIISLAVDQNFLALAWADLSTGEMQTLQIEYISLTQTLSDELAHLHPTECLLSESDYHNPDLLKILKQEKDINIYPFLKWPEITEEAERFLKKHFAIKTLASFGIADKPLAQQACATLLSYLQDTQKGQLSHIKKITLSTSGEFLTLDKSTMTNLELFSTIRERDCKGSLLSVLDNTETAMGGRLLRQWIAKPLTSSEKIIDRYDTLQALIENTSLHQLLKGYLKEVPDIERILSRLSVGIGNARDLVNLKHALHAVLQIKSALTTLKTPLSQEIEKQISSKLEKVVTEIEQKIIEEPAMSLREGGLIKNGVNTQLDSLRKEVGGGREWVLTLEKEEKERTGINSLKVRYNKVFGFYIEVSKPNVHLVPENYLRKQTLVNGERYITPELKAQEEIILTAEVEINQLEYEIFQLVLQHTLKFVEEIQVACQGVAVLDILSGFAHLSQKHRYTRPKLIFSGEIKIKGGRHPVVEQLLEGTQFVPNDVPLNQADHQLLVITGPNMAGKSVFIRQVALIVLMAQVGSFVPADKAYITPVDKIFVRSGASDVITSGLSTFMVEMMETAHILNHATSNSLIVMDEIGRGTSTYDGISIAWAVAQYLVSTRNCTPKTLFATHYHELQALERRFPKKIKNYHLAVDSSNSDPIFLHTIMPGAASHSFGVAVAKLAGIPTSVIDNALSMLSDLESRDRHSEPNGKANNPQGTPNPALKEIQKLDIYKLTPLEALNYLARFQEEMKK